MKHVRIGNKIIGEGYPAFIIAEIGSNHNQSLKTAKKLIDMSKHAGADAVKFQSFTVENWLSKEFISFPTVKERRKSLRRMLKNCELPYDMYREIKSYCAKKNIICFSSPSHIDDVEALLRIGTPAIILPVY